MQEFNEIYYKYGHSIPSGLHMRITENWSWLGTWLCPTTDFCLRFMSKFWV